MIEIFTILLVDRLVYGYRLERIERIEPIIIIVFKSSTILLIMINTD